MYIFKNSIKTSNNIYTYQCLLDSLIKHREQAKSEFSFYEESIEKASNDPDGESIHVIFIFE